MASTNTKKDESSIARAPQVMTPECFRIAGIAMLPIADAPVKNLVALTQLFDHISIQEINFQYNFQKWKQVKCDK